METTKKEGGREKIKGRRNKAGDRTHVASPSTRSPLRSMLMSARKPTRPPNPWYAYFPIARPALSSIRRDSSLGRAFLLTIHHASLCHSPAFTAGPYISAAGRGARTKPKTVSRQRTRMGVPRLHNSSDTPLPLPSSPSAMLVSFRKP